MTIHFESLVAYSIIIKIKSYTMAPGSFTCSRKKRTYQKAWYNGISSISEKRLDTKQNLESSVHQRQSLSRELREASNSRICTLGMFRLMEVMAYFNPRANTYFWNDADYAISSGCFFIFECFMMILTLFF